MAWRPRFVDVLILAIVVCIGVFATPMASALLGLDRPEGKDCRLLWDAAFDAAVYGLSSKGLPPGEDVSDILAKYSRLSGYEVLREPQCVLLFVDLSSPNGALAAVAAALVCSRSDVPLSIVCAPPAYGRELNLPRRLPGNCTLIRDSSGLAGALLSRGILRTIVVDSGSRITFSWTGFDAANYLPVLTRALRLSQSDRREGSLALAAALPELDCVTTLAGVPIACNWESGKDYLLHIVTPRCSVCRQSAELVNRLAASGVIPATVRVVTILTQVPLPEDIPPARSFFSEGLVENLFELNGWRSPSFGALDFEGLSRWARTVGLDDANVLVDTTDEVLHTWGLRTAPVLVWIHNGAVKQFFQVYWGCGAQPNALDVKAVFQTSFGG